MYAPVPNFVLYTLTIAATIVAAFILVLAVYLIKIAQVVLRMFTFLEREGKRMRLWLADMERVADLAFGLFRRY